MVPASMRWMPSMRMSRMVKGSNAWADRASSIANRAARNAARNSLVIERRLLSRELAVDVVVERKDHQEQEHGEAESLAQLHHALRYGAALHNLDDVVQQVPPVQQRNGQQIQHAQADADEREEGDVGAQPQ